jgi:ectoine hydroxylase-related dioxygenase (phytanoyl-CoA dioxygenase family)
MKQTYAVRLSKLSKFFGESNENYKSGKIHEEEYIFEYATYSEALEEYQKHCTNAAKSLAVQIIFASTYTVQLLDWEGTNPQTPNTQYKRGVMFQITISNL